MNIFFVSPSIALNKGGVERHVLEVAKRLAKNNKVTIVTEASNVEKTSISSTYHSGFDSDSEAKVEKSTGKSSFFVRKKIENINVLYFDFGKEGFKKKFIIWRKMLQLAPLIGGADVIHCHDVFVWVLPLRIIFPFKRIYVTFHGYEGYPIASKAKLIRKVSKFLSNGSINVGNFIEKWYGTKGDKITFGAVDESEFKKKPDSIPVKSDMGVRIAFIGRLERINCLPQLLDALRLLRRKRVNFILECYGDGSMVNQCMKMGKVFTQRADFQQHIASSDLIFSSSYLSILEGLINKKRVLSLYDNPLKRDYLFLTPFSHYISISSNSKELAREIESSIESKTKYNADIEKGYSWAKKQTWDALTQEYLSLWKI